MYLTKTPALLKSFYNDQIWDIPTSEKTLFLTFDDGPVPEATPFVLDLLKQYNIPATFFCIGDNVRKHPELFQRILAEGHQVGNHSHNHLNGWKFNDFSYVKNVLECSRWVTSSLYRPPYGKIKRSQSVALSKRFSIIMWDVISGDFDQSITPQKCVENVVKNVAPGSIIVFHDSIKAFDRMSYALPRTLEYLKKEGYSFEVIPQNIQPSAAH